MRLCSTTVHDSKLALAQEVAPRRRQAPFSPRGLEALERMPTPLLLDPACTWGLRILLLPGQGGRSSSSSAGTRQVVTVCRLQHPPEILQLPQSSLQHYHLTALELSSHFFHAWGRGWPGGGQGFVVPSPQAGTRDA